ncbi:hypothetical protein KI387_041785, partial [Taxus chinensis]
RRKNLRIDQQATGGPAIGKNARRRLRTVRERGSHSGSGKQINQAPISIWENRSGEPHREEKYMVWEMNGRAALDDTRTDPIRDSNACRRLLEIRMRYEIYIEGRALSGILRTQIWDWRDKNTDLVGDRTDENTDMECPIESIELF